VSPGLVVCRSNGFGATRALIDADLAWQGHAGQNEMLACSGAPKRPASLRAQGSAAGFCHTETWLWL
jgi:hypothetical protein